MNKIDSFIKNSSKDDKNSKENGNNSLINNTQNRS